MSVVPPFSNCLSRTAPPPGMGLDLGSFGPGSYAATAVSELDTEDRDNSEKRIGLGTDRLAPTRDHRRAIALKPPGTKTNAKGLEFATPAKNTIERHRR